MPISCLCLLGLAGDDGGSSGKTRDLLANNAFITRVPGTIAFPRMRIKVMWLPFAWARICSESAG